MKPVKRELVNYTIPAADQNRLAIIELIGRMIEENRKKYDLPPFYIAGGCIRDACVGRWPKDYDVFVPQGDNDLSYLSLYAEGMKFAGTGGLQEGNPYEEQEGSEDWNIDNYTSPFSPRPVQFIEKPFDNGIDLIEEFDYNVVKAFWTPEGFHFHEDFVSGINDKRSMSRTNALCPLPERQVGSRPLL